MKRIYLSILATALIGKVAFAEVVVLHGHDLPTAQDIGKLFACTSVNEDNQINDEFFRIFSTPIDQWTKADKKFIADNNFDSAINQEAVRTSFIEMYNQLKSLCQRDF